MMKKVSHKILAWILGICLIVGLIPLTSIMADDASTSETGTVTYSAEWTSSSTIDLTITSTVNGTAYYLLSTQDIASSADLISSNYIKQYGTPVTCSAGDTVVSINSVNADALDIYVTFENVDDYTTLSLLAYSAMIDATSYDFGSEEYGYTAPTAKDFTVTNTGSNTIKFALAENSFTGFTVTFASTSVAAGGTTTLTVQPKTGLDVGTYESTITLNATTEDNTTLSGLTLSTTVSFAVTEATTNVYDYYPYWYLIGQ